MPPTGPFLSVVMPVYNEKATVEAVMKKVLAVEFVKELIVVDDGSTDGTRELLRTLPDTSRLHLFFPPKNQGKGAALREGFSHVTGEIVLVQDADLEYDPADYPELVKPIRDGFADAVYGTRLSGGKPQRVHLFWHKVGNRFLTLLTNFLYNTTLTDMETGYKVIRADVLKEMTLRSRGFNIEPEITAKLLRRRRRLYEVPICYYGRGYGEGKKISWRHGFSAVAALLRFRFFN